MFSEILVWSLNFTTKLRGFPYFSGIFPKLSITNFEKTRLVDKTTETQVVKLLTEDVEGLTGGKVALGDDPVQAAKDMEAHIIKKRQKMGLA